MEQEQPQQPPPQIHRGVLEGIARLTHHLHSEVRHKLWIRGFDKPPVDRQSLHHLVDFYHTHHRDTNDVVVISELELDLVRLSHPADGGLNILSTFFSGSNTTTLTKVALKYCDFGTNQEDASQLLAAFTQTATSRI
jgi:hypothetical protein